MKMKKILGNLAIGALVAGAPVTLTSCNEDDVNTILGILELFTSTDDLNNTEWANYQTANGTKYISVMMAFGNGQVEIAEESYTDKDGNAIVQKGTYTLDTSTNVLTMNLDTGKRQYTVKEFKKNTSMTLVYNGRTLLFVPYTE